MLCLPCAHLSAQTGIGTAVPLPNAATAELEVASADKGVLIPRMTDAEMQLIASPAEGLLVYNLTYKTFYYFSTTWKPAGFAYRTLIRDTDGDTRIEVEKTSDEDIVRFSANADNNGVASGAADEVATISSAGFNLISENSTYQIEGTQVLRKKNNNVYVGTGGALTTSGDRNTSFGYGALDKITTGSDNLAVGYNAGLNLATANNSVLVGDNVSSGPALSGNGNVAIGASAAPVMQGAATNNVVVGYKSGTGLTTGKHNILIGYNAGSNITTADSNIVIGINQTVPDPTKNGQCNIGGVIGSDSIYNIKGNVKFANAYTFPDKSSLADYTFVMGSGGNLGWGEKNVAGEANITVTGAATNMQPWSRIFADGSLHDAYGLFMVPVTAMANGSISKISTHLYSTSANTTLYFGLYRADGTVANNGAFEFKGSIAVTAGTTGVVTIDFYDPGNQSFAVTAGTKYYIAVADPNDKIKFIRNNDPDAQMSKSGSPFVGPLLSTYTIPLGSNDGDVIWVRAH